MLGQVGIRRQQRSVRQAAVGAAKGNSGAKGLETLSPVEISRAERRVPEAISRMRVDAEEILRLVLHRLDEMKFDDTLTGDLRDIPSIRAHRVASSGRPHCHVGSVADW